MNTTKVIYDKLFTENRVELESHRIELSLVEDLKKAFARLKAIDGATMKSTQKMVNSLNTFIKVQSDLKDSYNQSLLDSEDAQDEIKAAIKLVENVAKVAKDLGLNPNDVKGTKEIVDFTANIEDTIAIFKRNAGDAKKIIAI